MPLPVCNCLRKSARFVGLWRVTVVHSGLDDVQRVPGWWLSVSEINSEQAGENSHDQNLFQASIVSALYTPELPLRDHTSETPAIAPVLPSALRSSSKLLLLLGAAHTCGELVHEREGLLGRHAGQPATRDERLADGVKERRCDRQDKRREAEVVERRRRSRVAEMVRVRKGRSTARSREGI